MVAGVTVVVETLLLGNRDGRLTYRTAEQQLSDAETPDGLARHLAGFTTAPHVEGRMLHSTSWRFDHGRIVLTYAALPDPDPRTAAVLEPPRELIRGSDPLTPSPPQIDQTDVVAHACRHLAFLRTTDPVVQAASQRHPAVWTQVFGTFPDTRQLCSRALAESVQPPVPPATMNCLNARAHAVLSPMWPTRYEHSSGTTVGPFPPHPPHGYPPSP